MSLFSKTEISEEILPFIENGEGVGVVKVNGYGKASARMESYKIIFDSYEGKSPIIESVSAITYLSYKKGNFLNEPKLEIGISHKKYILGGVDNNDAELETFYKTILDIKNLEKEQKTSSYMGIKKSNVEEETKNIAPVSNEVIEDDNAELEQELPQEEIKEEDVVEESPDENINDSTEDLEKIIEDDEEDFEVLDAPEEVVETSETPQEEQEEVSVDDSEIIDKDVVESSDELAMEDYEDEDEFEEIFIESNEAMVDEFDEDNLFSDEPIIEDFDEDFDDFDDELTDNDDSGRIIKESETTQSEEIEEEVFVEDDISSESESEEERVDESESREETIDESESQKENVTEIKEETSSHEEVVSETEEIIAEDQMQQNLLEDNTEITAENVTSEIGKMKQQLYGGINNIQNELNNNQKSGSAGVNMQFDPVDQIRRYHELKEDGIITEEEFELKKKQLLDL